MGAIAAFQAALTTCSPGFNPGSAFASAFASSFGLSLILNLASGLALNPGAIINVYAL